MSGFGDLFGALGDLIGGAMEIGAGEAVAGAVQGERPEVRSQTETYDRMLAGAKRELDINDR